MIVNLSTVVPDGLVCPEGKRRIEYVDKGTGLYVEVRATAPGEGTFYLRYRNASGKTCHQKIGRTTDIDLDEARLRAKKLKAEITLGQDPKAVENNAKSIITLNQLMDDYVRPYLEHRVRSAKRYGAMFDNRIRKPLGKFRIDQLSRQQITAYHTGLVKDEGLAPATANRHLALLRRILAHAVGINLLHSNPASHIQMYRESGTEHYLQADDLQNLLTVLTTGTKRNFMVRMLALFLLATGARLNEALRAKWQDIDRENRVWRIPASNSKSKKVRSVPLNDSAIEVLDQLGTEGKIEWLFQSVTGDRLKYVHRVWERLRIKAGLPHLRLHDLRHQHASFLVNSGRTLYEVQAILGHNDPSVTQRYAHLSTKTLQDASDSASAMIQGAMKKSA